MRLKDIVNINTSTLPENTDNSYIFKYIDISSISSEGEICSDEYFTFYDAPSRARRIVKKGDVLVSTVRTYLRAIAPIRFDAKDVIASTGFAVCTPKKITNSQYLTYAIKNNRVIDDICKESTGVSYPAITASRLSSINIPYTNIEEQKAIADYLDKKTGEIDTQIRLLEQKQQAYEKLKKSLISEIITVGLLPNTELKDSGEKWIGEVPRHWHVRRFKELFKHYSTGFTPDSKDTSNFSDEDINTWVTIADLNSRIVSKSSLSLSTKAISEHKPVITPKGSLLFSFKLSIGKTAFAGKDLYTNEAIVTIPPQKNMDLRYFYYLLPEICINNATENIYGAKMLNQQIIANMIMPLPPIEEQQTIADYLDRKIDEIDHNKYLIGKQINAYKQLKQSLINEVITGKRKIY